MSLNRRRGRILGWEKELKQWAENHVVSKELIEEHGLSKKINF